MKSLTGVDLSDQHLSDSIKDDSFFLDSAEKGDFGWKRKRNHCMCGRAQTDTERKVQASGWSLTYLLTYLFTVSPQRWPLFLQCTHPSVSIHIQVEIHISQAFCAVVPNYRCRSSHWPTFLYNQLLPPETQADGDISFDQLGVTRKHCMLLSLIEF